MVFGQRLPQQILLLTQLYGYTELTYEQYWVKYVWKARLLERKLSVVEHMERVGGWLNGKKYGRTKWEFLT